MKTKSAGRGGAKVSAIQGRLRASLLKYITDNPGSPFIQIIADHSDYLKMHLKTAMSFLSKNKFIYKTGNSKYSRWFIGDGFNVQEKLSGSELAKNPAIPDRVLSHAEYWLFILGRSAEVNSISGTV